ncbi:MAG: hypothetical protein ACKVLM_23255 [Pseudomonadales bacterium]
MPQSLGMCSNRVNKALRPPADAPIPTTGNFRVLRVSWLFFGVDASRLVVIKSSALFPVVSGAGDACREDSETSDGFLLPPQALPNG